MRACTCVCIHLASSPVPDPHGQVRGQVSGESVVFFLVGSTRNELRSSHVHCKCFYPPSNLAGQCSLTKGTPSLL